MLSTPNRRAITYGVAFVAGIGLLIYGIQVGADVAINAASSIIGAALGAAGLRGVKE